MIVRTHFVLVCLIALGCVACDYDYTGEYDMNYYVALDPRDGERVVAAGSAVVEVRPGLEGEWLIDLGRELCPLVATGARTARGLPPYLRIEDQTCWFDDGKTIYDLQVSGFATAFDHEQSWEEIGFTIALRGIFWDEERRGVATLDFDEAY